jgi:hypothetical protein
MIILPLYCTTPGNVGDLFNLVPMTLDKLKIKIIQGIFRQKMLKFRNIFFLERFLHVNIEEKV